MTQHVKGTLFVDYVRMLRAHKTRDWSGRLPSEDLRFLSERIEPDRWYPMDSFERLGLAILDEVAGGELLAAREWGRRSADLLASAAQGVLVPGDPRESVMRFQVARRSFFDFDPITVTELTDNNALIEVNYGMSERAEQAACHQTLGFFQRLLELAGGANPRAVFEARAWEGDERTLISLTWAAGWSVSREEPAGL